VNSQPQSQDIIRVVLVGDLRDVREGLAVLINGSPGLRCAAAVRTMEEALRLIHANLPDVVLTDIGLPGMSGIEGIRILRERHPDLPMIALTVYDDDERIFDALCAGASGYLLKNTPPARLLEGLKEVASGGAPMSPEVARRVINLFREFRLPDRSPSHLSARDGVVEADCRRPQL
jgi:DNA-binding NarL/FixJ family response regulator